MNKFFVDQMFPRDSTLLCASTITHSRERMDSRACSRGRDFSSRLSVLAQLLSFVLVPVGAGLLRVVLVLAALPPHHEEDDDDKDDNADENANDDWDQSTAVGQLLVCLALK